MELLFLCLLFGVIAMMLQGQGGRDRQMLIDIQNKLDLLLTQAGIAYDPFAKVPGEVTEAIRNGRRIEAIKRYRQATGTGLKEAREFVETLMLRTKG